MKNKKHYIKNLAICCDNPSLNINYKQWWNADFIWKLTPTDSHARQTGFKINLHKQYSTKIMAVHDLKILEKKTKEKSFLS